MKHESHRLLAQHLLELGDRCFQHRGWRRAFLIGNLLPDYNLFTYLRGLGSKGWLVGHDQVSSEERCEKIALRLKEKGLRSVFDCYTLGTLIHYLADSYTYPHTVSFREPLRVHNAYERTLKQVFPDCQASAVHWQLPDPPNDLVSFLKNVRASYEGTKRDPRSDGTYVLWVCSMVYLSIVKENRHLHIQNQRK